MCFAKSMTAYLFENKQLVWIAGLIQVFEIEHHRPNPRTARETGAGPGKPKDTQAFTKFLVAEVPVSSCLQIQPQGPKAKVCYPVPVKRLLFLLLSLPLLAQSPSRSTKPSRLMRANYQAIITRPETPGKHPAVF
jgi:hypothetical protein